MISYDEFTAMADELANELPECFYTDLNGGVNVIERFKLHPQSAPNRPLFTLGEYVITRETGRAIYIYYGSFRYMFPRITPEALKDELRKTIRHEFRHHIETLAGENALVLEDEKRIREYEERWGKL